MALLACSLGTMRLGSTFVLLAMAALAGIAGTSFPAAMAANTVPAPTASCDDAINSLVSCYTFVTGGSSRPTDSCCTAFGQVQKDQPACLCDLFGSDSSSTGINITLALEIPTLCGSQASTAACQGGTPAATPAAGTPPLAGGTGQAAPPPSVAGGEGGSPGNSSPCRKPSLLLSAAVALFAVVSSTSCHEMIGMIYAA